MKTSAHLATAALFVGLLAGCAGQPSRPVSAPVPSARPQYVQYGQVMSVNLVRAQEHSVGAGAVLGGVVGGVLGHQVGSGSGKDAATVAGVVGGALIGNEIEKRQQAAPDLTRVAIRFDNGSQRNFDYAQAVDLRAGDRVRVDGDRVARY